MKRIFLIFLAIFAFSVPQGAEAKKQPKMTPAELQAIQSKEFDVSKEEAFSALMTVIQDLGYQVESADLQTGFITASSPTENKTGFFDVLGGVSSSGNTRMTAYIQPMPNGRSKIRLNFVSTKESSNWYGRDSKKDKPILDATVYNNAWARIDEAIFVADALKESVPPAPAEAAEAAAEAASEAVPQ